MRPRLDSPIGIFDSGVGGLTVVRQLRRVLPHEDLLYLGDTARVPYGTKSPETVVRFACEDTQFLVDHGVKAVVVACNTASAWALPVLRRKFDLPVFGVIDPGVQAAVMQTSNARIGVIGTWATIRSGAYASGIIRCIPSAKVISRACPLLVPLVEEGWTRHAVTFAVLEQYLQPLLRYGIDTLILGCTHYPLLKTAITSVAGKRVLLIDSARTCAIYARAALLSLGLLNAKRKRAGTIRPYVTDEPARFAVLAKRFLSLPTEPARRAVLG